MRVVAPGEPAEVEGGPERRRHAYAVHDLDVAGQQGALAAGCRRGADAGCCPGSWNDLDGWWDEVVAAGASTSTPCSQAAVRSVTTAVSGTTSATALVRMSRPSSAAASTYTPLRTRRSRPTRTIRRSTSRLIPSVDGLAVRERPVGGQRGVRGER